MSARENLELRQADNVSPLSTPVAPSERDSSPPRGNPFPIVGIGASAGGLEAFSALLSALPANSGMAFVLVQHLDPSHESALAQLLGIHTGMPVISVEDAMPVEPNHVYVIPPNTSIELRDELLLLRAREPGLHLPIDTFFRSLAKVQGSRAIAVVLSGNASDGSVGVRAVKAESGITFAQTEATARFSGMPRSAIATGAVDYVLSPAEIGQELGAIARHPFLIPSQPGDSSSEKLPEGEDDLRRIFALLNATTKVDFSRYKPTTTRRRIGRRMIVLRLDSIAEYARYVEHHPAELRELYRDLLISVTSFFRDPESFETLGKLVTEMFANRQKREEAFRVWVPGCATGEEVYSIAICLFEIASGNSSGAAIQLFGTDISEVALDRARGGMYPVEIEGCVSKERLNRFFTRVDSGYRINKDIRETCIFARHDLTKDAPFSNVDLVSCRNLLIYLDQSAQKHVLPVFHYALKPGGLLFLGSAESVTSESDLFEALDSKHRIYSRKAGGPRLPMGISAPGALGEISPRSSVHAANSIDVQRMLDRVIQSKYSPDGVLIDSDFQVIQFRGHTGSYLKPSPGQAGLNVLRIARESLVLPIRRAVGAAAETNVAVRERGIVVERAGQAERITVEVTPVGDFASGRRHFLIVFAREQASSTGDSEGAGRALLSADEEPARLEQELRESQERFRDLTEQFETHAEELHAANEEARSTNEELQSTNEELRTTQEELQSANEELRTVNEELQSRNTELSATNSDLENLLGTVTVSILMVDTDLRVRRFNAAAAKLLDLNSLDVGRPIGHIRGRIETPSLEEPVKTVIETLHATSQELQDKAGCWYVLTVRPYRTIDDRIAGAVVMLQDIDPLKRALQAAEAARDYAEGMIETVREPLVVLDADLRVQRATRAFYESFMVTPEETEGRFFYNLGNGQWHNARLRELISLALFRSEPFNDFELVHNFAHIGRRTMRLNGRRLLFPHSRERMLLLSIEDVTERHELAEIRFQRLFETAKDGIIVVDLERQTIQHVNAYMLDLTGHNQEDFLGKSINEVATQLGVPEIGNGLDLTRTSAIVRFEDLRLQTRSNGILRVEVVGNAYQVGSQWVVQFNVRDVSRRNQALEALRQSEQRFRLFVESVHDYALFQTDQEGRIVTWNVGAERLLGWTEQEVIGQPSLIVFTPEDIQNGEAEKELATARAKGRAEDERWHIRKDRTRFFASGVLTQVCDEHGQLLGFAKVMRDVTSRKEQEEQLRRSVFEKDTLVREIHHRVKNNLQVIVSLLTMQSRHSTDPRVLSAFNDAESRLRAIARIHERLYASEDLTTVEFSEFVGDLVRELIQLHNGSPDQIELDLNVVDMALHVERAIPLGLIANELILNSLKHGLQGKPGRLSVNLIYLPNTTTDQSADAWGQLQITDSGPGLPSGFDVTSATSMGLRLVNMLVRQLRGNLKVDGENGASWTISFPLEEPRKPGSGGVGAATRSDR